MSSPPFRILYEDDFFLAAEKPAGLSTQATLDPQRPHFYGELKKYFPYLGLHHRLDRDTSGVLLFSKDKKVNAPLAQLFKTHAIQKTYLCLCQKRGGPEHFVVKNHLVAFQKSRKDKVRMVLAQSGGDLAETHFHVLNVYENGQLVQARPQTGRMHQIRVHLSSRGMGIFGDELYASPPTPPAPRLMLHAWKLEFIHPLTQKLIFIDCPLPEDFSDFQARLQASPK